MHCAFVLALLSTATSHNLVKDRDGADDIPSHQGLFYLHEIPPSRVAKTNDWTSLPPELARSLGRGESGCGEYFGRELVLPLYLSPNCTPAKTGVTATAMGDINTGHTLECTHRRQLLASLSERSLTVRGPSFPRTKMTGDENIVDLVVLSALQLSDVHVESSPREMQRADASHDSLQMPTNVGKSASTLSREPW